MAEAYQASSILSEQMGERPYPLANVCKRWVAVIEQSKKVKHQEFGQWADEALQFFDGPLNWMWDQMKPTKNGNSANFISDSGDSYKPTFLMSVNRLFEAVAMFGPVLYHQNPVIAVTPRQYPAIAIETMYAGVPEALQALQLLPALQAGVPDASPEAVRAIQLKQQYEAMQLAQQQRQIQLTDHAKILEHYSNWLQQEGDKKSEARHAITEAIITGMGMMEIVPDRPASSGRMVPRARYRSVKDLFIDPDAKYWRDVTWIAIRCCAPVNQVEDEYGLPKGSLKGHFASRTSTAGRSAKRQPKHGNGQPAGITHDIIEYYKVYSKNGAGQHLKTPGSKETDIPDWLGELGDFTYFAVAKDVPYFLNISPEVMQIAQQMDEQADRIMQQLQQMEAMGQVPEDVPEPQYGITLLQERAAWPVPYWSDAYSDGGWPIVRLSFYQKPGQVWPVSMCKSCIGELRFVNWCMSFLADRVASGSKTFVAVLKEAAGQIKDQISSQSGPFTYIELEKILNKPINQIIEFMNAPNVQTDIWRMVAEVNETIDKRLGLTELVYGLSSRQMRSAAEAQYRQQNINVRPDDMAGRVEDWLSLVATREIQALRWSGNFDDVLPVIGPIASQVFETQILTQDVESITREFNYRVQAGTARKPSKDTKIAQLNDFAQYLLPTIQPLAQAGITRPYNAFLKDMANAMEMDATEYLLTPEDQQRLAMMAAPPAPPENRNGDGNQENAE